jgi:ATP-dependent RNA helicase DDX54/DBP10
LFTKFQYIFTQDGKNKRVKTEDGRWVKATYKTGRYEDWKKRSKLEEQQAKWDEEDWEESGKAKKAQKKPVNPNKFEVLGMSSGNRWKKLGSKGRTNGELKNPDQIMKIRKIKKKKELAQKGRKGRPGKGGGGQNGGKKFKR